MRPMTPRCEGRACFHAYNKVLFLGILLDCWRPRRRDVEQEQEEEEEEEEDEEQEEEGEGQQRTEALGIVQGHSAQFGFFNANVLTCI